ncbi:MAG TPA: carbohydrate-binding protein, partial [Polyangiaceae bacterium]|nr:carbohydrate-binding protein [Polyangiaceae bacterium]
MRSSVLSGFASMILGLSATTLVGCGTSAPTGAGAEEHVGEQQQLITYAPQPVAHPNTSKRIFMHMMPWFEANGVQHGYTRHGTYGSHWTMANCTAQTNGLLNRICADDAPMIGAYSSSDPYVVEYQLLTMKYAGIDGVVLDWGGVVPVGDLPDNKYNGEAMMSQLSNFGLKFMVFMEDRNYVRNNGPNDFGNPINNSDDQNDMANDLNCLKANGTCGNLYFGSGNYEKLAGNNTPIVGDFGPVNYRVSNGNQWVWDNAWSQAGMNAGSTTLYSLWWQEGDEGNNGDMNRGSSAWVWSGAGAVGNSSWTILDHESYYAANGTAPGSNRVKMGSIVPAYYPYYQAGGWSSDAASFTISFNNGAYVDQLFDINNGSNENYMQLVTWNDYGEGTGFEPSVNKGYAALNHLQQKLGVAYGTNELTLVYNLFNARVAARKANDTARLANLDQASAYLAALNTSAAASIINGTSAEGPYGNGGNPWAVPGTIEAENYDVGGDGVAYHDTEATNQGGQYRTSDGVDVEACGEGGYDVGWTNGGEYMKYTVNVASTGTYKFAFRVANGGTGTGTFAVNVDGNALTGNLNVAPTGGWQTWTTVNSGNVS